jgi:alpha-glucosidase (family GH31 glycosyl hydrolase)
MWLAGSSAPGAKSDSQQWMLGRDALVAPILYQGAAEREVSFPEGCWEHQAPGGDTYQRPTKATVPGPLGQLPFFLRCGKKPFPPG